MTWQLLLFISISAAVGMTLSQRLLIKEGKTNPIAYSVGFQMLGGILCIIFALTRGLNFNGIFNAWPNLILMIVFWSVANLFTFKALKITEASKFMVLFSSRALWIILIGVFLFHESFTFKQVIGTLLILFSIILVSRLSKKLSFEKGEIFTLVAAMAFGFGIANDSFIVRNADVFTYFPIAFIAPATATWALYPSVTREVFKLYRGKEFLLILVPSFFAALSGSTYYLAYQVGRNAAQLASINQTYTIITVVLAVFFLGEKENAFLKILAAIVSFIGVLLIT